MTMSKLLVASHSSFGCIKAKKKKIQLKSSTKGHTLYLYIVDTVLHTFWIVFYN